MRRAPGPFQGAFSRLVVGVGSLSDGVGGMFVLIVDSGGDSMSLSPRFRVASSEGTRSTIGIDGGRTGFGEYGTVEASMLLRVTWFLGTSLGGGLLTGGWTSYGERGDGDWVGGSGRGAEFMRIGIGILAPDIGIPFPFIGILLSTGSSS